MSGVACEKGRGRTIFLQDSTYFYLTGRGGWLLCAVLVLLSPLASGGAADASYTPGQLELLRELETHEPPGAEPGSKPWLLRKWDVDFGMSALLPEPTRPDNAAEHFFRLEALYPSEKAALAAGDGAAAGVDEFLAAAESVSCRFTPDVYPPFESISAKQPDFAVLRAYLQGAQDRATRLERGGDLAGAERCHQAVLLCGRHLTTDNYSALVYMTGIIFKVRGAQEYESFLRRNGRSEKADAIARGLRGLLEVLRLFNWKANDGLSRMEGFASLPTAIRIAATDEEPCWRKEALTRIAVLRHGVPVIGDTTVMMHNAVFEKLAENALVAAAAADPDPSVRRLAIWLAFNIKPRGEVEHQF